MATINATGAAEADRRVFLLRHKWKALGLFVTIMGGAVAVTALTPRTYRSEAKLFVRLGRENATVDPTASLGKDPVVAVPITRDSEINSVVEILSSRSLLEKVVDAVGPDVILERPGLRGGGGWGSTPARQASFLGSIDWRSWLERLNLATPLGDRDRAIVWLQEKLSVRPVRKSEVVVVWCDAPSPELAQKVVTRLVEFYLAEHGRLSRTPGVLDFFTEQASVTRQRLTKAEERIREFKNRTSMISPDVQRQLLATRMSHLDDELAKTTAAIAAAEARIRGYRDTLVSEPEAAVTSQIEGYSDEGTDRMREQFYVLQMQEQAAAVKYTEDHPLYKQMHEQTTAAKVILGQEGRSRTQVTTAPTKRREQAELAIASEQASLAALVAEAAARRDELTQLRGDLKAFNEHDLEVARLQREVDLCAGSYRKYAESLEQARIDQALERERISNISVVQPATYDALPVRPRTATNLLLGLAAGLSGAAGLAYLADGRRRDGPPQSTISRPRSAVSHHPTAAVHPR